MPDDARPSIETGLDALRIDYADRDRLPLRVNRQPAIERQRDAKSP